VAEAHQFTYGAFNPVAACLVAFLGSFLGLLSAGRARAARTRGRRNRWLIIAAFAIGGGAVWLMHFTAMLGFDVPTSPVRYNPMFTVVSLGQSVVTVGIGLLVVGHGRRSIPKVVAAGIVTGIGVMVMHYTGMYGVEVAGTIHYRPPLVVASGIIAVVAATAALWFTVSVHGWRQITCAAAVSAVAVCGMHYTAMAAVTVHLNPLPPYTVNGIRPMLMIVPITLITAATIIAVALSALQAMTEEEFTDGAVVPRRGVHAEHPWSLRDASMAAIRRTPGPRPSPRPVPPRPKSAPAEEMLEPVVGS
jgi:NO-binding membrane sensor protein with MHYT domain